MIIKLNFELEPENNLHKYIPEHIVKETGITKHTEDLVMFAQCLFNAGAEWQGSEIEAVFEGRSPDKEIANICEETVFNMVYDFAISGLQIENTDNARSLAMGCFFAGKRYVVLTFAAACEKVTQQPFWKEYVS